MKRALAVACRLGLGALFLYSAAAKLPDLSAFAQDTANYRLLPAALVPWASTAMLGIEAVVGLALLLGIGARAAALVAVGMLGVFIVAICQALLRGIDLRCGCFGGNEPASWLTVLRDVGLLVPALFVAGQRAEAPPPAASGSGP